MQRPLIWCVVASAATCLAVLLVSGPASALSTGNGGWQWQDPLPQGNGYASGWFLDASHGWLVSGGASSTPPTAASRLTVQARHNVSFNAHHLRRRQARLGGRLPGRRQTGTAIVYRTTNGGRRWTPRHARLEPAGQRRQLRQHRRSAGRSRARRPAHLRRRPALVGRVRPPCWRAAAPPRAGAEPAVGLVAGTSGTLLRTVDGGATWKRFIRHRPRPEGHVLR